LNIWVGVKFITYKMPSMCIIYEIWNAPICLCCNWIAIIKLKWAWNQQGYTKRIEMLFWGCIQHMNLLQLVQVLEVVFICWCGTCLISNGEWVFNSTTNFWGYWVCISTSLDTLWWYIVWKRHVIWHCINLIDFGQCWMVVVHLRLWLFIVKHTTYQCTLNFHDQPIQCS
jgi:hypothetical protein